VGGLGALQAEKVGVTVPDDGLPLGRLLLSGQTVLPPRSVPQSHLCRPCWCLAWLSDHRTALLSPEAMVNCWGYV